MVTVVRVVRPGQRVEPAAVEHAQLERHRLPVQVEDVAPEPAVRGQRLQARSLPVVADVAHTQPALVCPRGDGLDIAEERVEIRAFAEDRDRQAVAEVPLELARGAARRLARGRRDGSQVVLERRLELDLPAHVGPGRMLPAGRKRRPASAAPVQHRILLELAEEDDVGLPAVERREELVEDHLGGVRVRTAEPAFDG